MDDDVLGADRREAIAAELADALGKARREGRELQVRPVLLVKLVQLADAEERAAFGDERADLAKLVAQHRLQRLGHPGLQLQPDYPPAPAALDGVGEIADDVLRFLLDLDIAVAQHTELRRAEHPIAGEQHRRETLHDRFDRHVARLLPRQADEAAHRRGQHHQLTDRLVVGQAHQVEHHRQPLVGQEREGMRRIERLRRQHR